MVKKGKKQTEVVPNTFFGKIAHSLSSLNNSKFFAGLVMILLNIGSKYITIKISKSQEAYLRNNLARQMLIFAIAWMGTKDILIALAITAVFHVLTAYLFNEESSWCIIPKHLRQFEEVLDLNGDGKVTPDEIAKAKEVLEKAKKIEKKRENLRNLYRK
tara:strand:+ start:490 stop:966 length:477 start_codon:yes stop_codon:yes gene_type:complete